MLGYDDIVQLLGDENGLRKSDIFICQEHGNLESSESMDYKDFTGELMKKGSGQTNVDAIYTSLLKSPVLGLAEYQEKCFKKESGLMKREVNELMKRFSEQFGRQYPLLAFTPKLRESIGEGAKCGLLSEYDYMLIMSKFYNYCQVNSISNCKSKFEMMTFPSIDEEISSFERNLILHILMRKILLTRSIWEGLHLKFVSCKRINFGLCLSVVFNGHLYKFLQISMDLVSPIPLKMLVPVNDWPVLLDFSKCQLYGLFRDGYDGFDLSSTDYEEMLLKALPSAAIDAYVFGKAFSSVHFKWRGKLLAKIFEMSYTMKKYLLISLHQHENPQWVSRHECMKGIVFVASNMEKFVKKHECRRCIFHAEEWTRDEKPKNNCLKLYF
ncbi:hypothetical protein CAPTEDRAFT_204888 [Capitella teleta]|uniref:Mab-21-like HhH/H2TH-like domain-containing protein n=1 Tax=Capitella teleta TaxID=283909 RepID=R7U3B8_CAPTE|nr:hypothetical protein CAPTEDRAFT_204888 [Capitella teleta]|eukprot:ELU00444.1 hypothetical protein CAPTEDRAFT_204888 [Capitella teleta]